MLDIVNERLNAEGREPIAFEHDCREGICGSLRDDDQRPGPRPAEGHGHLPAPHAEVRRRRRDLHRAVAGPGLPRAEGPHRRPDRLRPHRRGGRLHHRPHRRRARRQPHADPQGGGRRGDGRGRLHRLRRLRGRLPEQRRAAVHRRPSSTTSTCCRRARPSATSGPQSMVDTMEDVLRLLHEPRRVPGGVPEGDLASTSSPT